MDDPDKWSVGSGGRPTGRSRRNSANSSTRNRTEETTPKSTNPGDEEGHRETAIVTLRNDPHAPPLLHPSGPSLTGESQFLDDGFVRFDLQR